MKNLIVLITLFLGLSLSLSLSAAASTKHFLFFVHGIGGTEKAFGYLPTALIKHLDAAQAGVHHEAFIFAYPTADQKLTTEDFAVFFGNFVHESLKDRIQAGDKISFISHSQGGLVTLIWYFNSFIQNRKVQAEVLSKGGNILRETIDFHPQYIPHIDAMITLGTPFWGSKLASKITEDTLISKVLAKSVFGQLGVRQLQEMAFSSKTNGKFRTNVINIPPAVLEEMKKSIRPLNIAGVADVVEILRAKTNGLSEYLKLFKGLTFGSRYWESDTAVPLPSARFDSIYTVDRGGQYVHGQVTPIENTQQSDFSPLLVINSIHASLLPSEIPDMVEIPKACFDSVDCKHPSFSYIYDHLRGVKVPEFAPDVPGEHLGGYMASFKLNFPVGAKANKLKVSVQLTSKGVSPNYELVFGNKRELISHAVVFNPNTPNIYFRTDAGHVKFHDRLALDSRKVRRNGHVATFLIQAEGYRARYVQTLLKPTYSTFVEVDMLPF